jgi:hypothetical protein
MAKEIYEILGRPVTKEQYEAAAKKMAGGSVSSASKRADGIAKKARPVEDGMKDKDKNMLGNLSPAYGMMTGHGAFGKLADSGVGGVIPLALASERRKKKDGTEMSPTEEEPTGMKKGGKVKSSASKRADGIAQRGKTKGRMV